MHRLGLSKAVPSHLLDILLIHADKWSDQGSVHKAVHIINLLPRTCLCCAFLYFLYLAAPCHSCATQASAERSVRPTGVHAGVWSPELDDCVLRRLWVQGGRGGAHCADAAFL